MVSFAIEEALANLTNPFDPKYTKKDVTEDTAQQGGDYESQNLANNFTEETWKEFCSKYKFNYFNSLNGPLGSTDIYVNYDTCLVIKFNSKEKRISGFFWIDSRGEYHSDSLISGNLSTFYDNYFRAVFPKEVNNSFIYLINYDFSEYRFFPSRHDDSIVWEIVYKELNNLKNDENSDFVDKVCSIIKLKVDEDTKESANVKVEEGEKVFRYNIRGDSSYCDGALTVVSVESTYVGLYFSDGIIKGTIYTRRGEFWKNFKKIEELESELLSFMLKTFKNVLNSQIINSIIEQKEYQGEVSFTRYRSSSGFLRFYSKRLMIMCANPHIFIEEFSVSIKLIKDSSEDREVENWTEGFYTDILLALALGHYEIFEDNIRNLFDFCKQLRIALGEKYLLFDSVESILSDVQNNIITVQKFLESNKETQQPSIPEKEKSEVKNGTTSEKKTERSSVMKLFG